MSNEASFAQRALAAFGAALMSLTLMVGYFAAPHMHSISTVLA